MTTSCAENPAAVLQRTHGVKIERNRCRKKIVESKEGFPNAVNTSGGGKTHFILPKLHTMDVTHNATTCPN
jgi:hypothetical protein